MRRLAVALLLIGCTPPPTPEPAAREPERPPATAAAPTAPVEPPSPRFAVLTYPSTPCLGPPRSHAKGKKPPTPGPAISCEDATRRRDEWIAATSAIAAPARFPQKLPEASPRLDTRLDVSTTDAGTRLISDGPAGTLVVDLVAGEVQRVIQGAFDRPFPTTDAHLYLALQLPADLAPPMFRIYDVVGPTGQVEARLTGAVWVTSRVARGYTLTDVDQAKVDEWIREQLPPVRGPTLALAAGQSALFDAVQARWRVWTPPAAETDPEDEGSLLDLGAAGVAFAADPTSDTCLARWFGPADEVGKAVCRIVARPGGGARFTRSTGGGVELVDIDARGGEQVRVTLATTDALAVHPVPSPALEVAWEQGGRLTVETTPGQRRVKVGVPTCRGRAPYCSVDYARAVGPAGVLVEELRGPDMAHAHIAGLADPKLGKSACDVVDIDHRDDRSEALLRCGDEWTLRTWTVADGREVDSKPDDARVAAHETPRQANTLEVAGERVCAVDGLAHQGAACTGLQRYNAKAGVYEPAP